YPFTNTNVFNKYAPTWKNVTDIEEGATQSLKTPSTDNLDLSKAKSVAIQVKSENAVRLLVGALNGNNRVDTASSSGQKVSFVSTDGQKTELTIDANGYIQVQGMGAIVIPVELLKSSSLTALKQVVFETDSSNFSVVIGEIGYYDADGVYQIWYAVPNLADSSTGMYDKLFTAENSTVTHPTAPDNALKSIAAKATYGDVKVYWNADGKKDGDYVADENGASGTVTIVKDSYNMDAAQVMATANNKNGYMAVNLLSANMTAEETKGITFWAKNDTNGEISFNIEMDVRYKQTDTAIKYTRSRINIAQGGRFWLYDINTGKQTVYMTRPTATLPAHFEGWVRIPYDCFNRADWSTGDPKAMFENGVGKADTFIVYLGLSYDTHTFPINQPFVINNFGTYTTTPMFDSALVSNPTMTIPALMQNLPALPQVNQEV
ncbi:MAG: hypothetical protein K2M64_01005, partial [Clostridia bacterium]|nr:hypothetical protein [Clostridia bacterium]